MEKPGLNPGLLFLRAGSASPPAEKAGALERQVFWKALRSDTALGLEQTAGGFRAVTTREKGCNSTLSPSKNNKHACLPRTSRHSRRETDAQPSKTCCACGRNMRRGAFPTLQETSLRGRLSPPKCKLDKAERAQNPTEQRNLRKKEKNNQDCGPGLLYAKKNFFWLSIQAKILFSMFTKIDYGKDNKYIKNKMLYLESASFL